MDKKTLHVKILSPQRTLLETSVLSISSKNSQGKFDILPSHANFITFIQNSPISLHLLDKRKVDYQFPVAIIWAHQDQINIYTDILP